MSVNNAFFLEKNNNGEWFQAMAVPLLEPGAWLQLMLLCKGWELGRKGRKNPTPSAAAACCIHRHRSRTGARLPLPHATRLSDHVQYRRKKKYILAVCWD
jgi:hypothetical protein